MFLSCFLPLIQFIKRECPQNSGCLNSACPRNRRRRRRHGWLHFDHQPQSMLELEEPAETHITDEEIQALYKVIAELGNYICRTVPEAMELLLWARRLWA